MTSTPAVTQSAEVATVQALLTSMEGEIQKALPKAAGGVERFMRICLTTIRTSPGLLKCSQASLLGAIMRSAQLNLEPCNVLGRAYLVPYGKECTFILGYKGMIELVRRSGQVKEFYAEIVYDNEPFDIVLGTERHIDHKPLPPSKRGDKMLGAYSVCIMTNGTRSFHWMWNEEIEYIRDTASQSASHSSSPWKKYPTSMYKKTAVRQHSKWLPLSIEAQEAAAMDEAIEMGTAHNIYLAEGEALDMDSATAGDRTAENAAALRERIKDAKPDTDGEQPPERAPGTSMLTPDQDEIITALMKKNKITDDALVDMIASVADGVMKSVGNLTESEAGALIKVLEN